MGLIGTLTRRPAGLFAAGAVLALAIGGLAVAAIPDADGMIHGCYTTAGKQIGNLRVIDPEQTSCRTDETAISWNQQGERGEPGEPGEPGPSGPAGPPGGGQQSGDPGLSYTEAPNVASLHLSQGEFVPNVDPVVFQPGTIVGWHEELSVDWKSEDKVSDPVEREFAGASGRVVTMVAELASESTAPPLNHSLDSLRAMAHPVSKTIPCPAGEAPPCRQWSPPPNLLFAWGPPVIGEVMESVIVDLDISYTQMGSANQVMKARVTVVLAEVQGDLLLTNSFVPRTQVLMADGTSAPIAGVRVGDMVIAADPESGQRSSRRVTDTIVGDGMKSLVDIEVEGNVVTATDEHLFWVDDQHDWVEAKGIQAGDSLLLSSGDTIEVDSAREHAATQRVHNLTVTGAHSFFVLIGDNAVLVRDGTTTRSNAGGDRRLATRAPGR